MLAQAKLLENTARIIESLSAKHSGGGGGDREERRRRRRREERRRAALAWMDQPVLVNMSDSGAIQSISAGVMPVGAAESTHGRSRRRSRSQNRGDASNSRPLSKAALFDLVLSKLQVIAMYLLLF